MSAICSTSCGESVVPVEYHDLCEPLQRRHGYTYFGLIACDYEFIDILDPAEWATARTAGNVIISPPGILDIPKPTQASFDATGCGFKLTGVRSTVINYITYWQHADLDDFEFFDAIDQSAPGYRLFWWDCRDAFYIDRNWVAAVKAWTTGALTISGDTPGFEFSVTDSPWPIEGEEKLSQWSVGFTIETTLMIKAAFLPGVSSQLI